MTITTTDLLLEATGVSKVYGAVVALKSASLAVRPGEIHALMGANGAGKSTLVKILTGAVRPDGGTIAVRGHERTVHSPGEARRGGLVSVYQEPALIPDLDIRSNLRLTRTPVEPFRHWLAELGLENLDLSSMTRSVPLASLRIIDLARALAIEPDVLMLDEMTAALPANLTERVLSVIGAPEGRRSVHHLHLPSDDRDRRHLRPRDRAARRRDGRRGRCDRGLGGPDRRADARARSSTSHRRSRSARRPSCRQPRAKPRADRARPGARDEAPGRHVRPLSGRGPGRRRARGPGPGRAVRHPRRRRPSERRRAARGRLAGVLPPPRRRDHGRCRVRGRRPRRGAADAALGSREHRAAVVGPPPALGPDRPRARGDEGQRRGCDGSRSTRALAARCAACRVATSRR